MRTQSSVGCCSPGSSCDFRLQLEFVTRQQLWTLKLARRGLPMEILTDWVSHPRGNPDGMIAIETSDDESSRARDNPGLFEFSQDIHAPIFLELIFFRFENICVSTKSSKTPKIEWIPKLNTNRRARRPLNRRGVNCIAIDAAYADSEVFDLRKEAHQFSVLVISA